MLITQRQSVFGFLSLLLIGGLLLLTFQFISGAPLRSITITLFTEIVTGGLLLAYWHGWEYARHCLVIAFTLLTVISMPTASPQISLTSMIAPVVALAFTSPFWVAGSALTILLNLIIRAQQQGVSSSPTSIVFYIVLIGGMIITRLVLETSNRTSQQSQAAAEAAAQALTQANARLESTVAARTAELLARTVELEARTAAQADLLAEIEQQRTTIHDLSMPIIPVSATTLVMPLIGALDSQRLRQMQEQSLQALQRTSAHTLVLDITGVPLVDSQVAQELLNTVRAARLLGAQVVLVGIRPEVAQSMVGLGCKLQDTSTFSDLQSALDRVSTRV